MLDLTKKVLPSTIYVDGEYFPIYTDFQYWIRFAQIIQDKNPHDPEEFDFIYRSDRKPENRLYGYYRMIDFFAQRGPLPRVEESEDETIYYDYKLDADYIYAAFYEQYHIDILDPDLHLHWMKFNAMFKALHNTRFNEIESYRGYNPAFKYDFKAEHQKLKDAWTIEPVLSDAEQKALDAFNQQLKKKG